MGASLDVDKMYEFDSAVSDALARWTTLFVNDAEVEDEVEREFYSRSEHLSRNGTGSIWIVSSSNILEWLSTSVLGNVFEQVSTFTTWLRCGTALLGNVFE